MTVSAAQPLTPLPKPEILNVTYIPDNWMAVAIFNKAYMEITPLADRPRCVQISLPFLHPDSNGLAGADELPTLERFGDATEKSFRS